MVREAFKFAYEHLKPIDAVIVGMYPRLFDQVRANAGYTRDVGRRAQGWEAGLYAPRHPFKS